MTEFSGDEFIQIDKIAKSFSDRGDTDSSPKFVVFMGGVGSGKTSVRRQQLTKGYVHFDFGEIHTAISKVFGEENQKLTGYTSLASDMILQESLKSKKNIVIEIIGDNKDTIDTVVNKMNEIGYETSLKFISCDPAEAYRRHLNAVKEDKDYLSAYFTQEATLSFFYQQLELGEFPATKK